LEETTTERVVGASRPFSDGAPRWLQTVNDVARESRPSLPDEGELELSVVMPCLNERDTVGICVQKAMEALRNSGIPGEVIVADNGSTDGSQDIARSLGARVVAVTERGYGSALRGGIAAARGRYVIMGDADDSYDFTIIGDFYERLTRGYDIVQGCRLPRGGGTILPNAMPFLHRWWGNPMFTRMANVAFRVPVNDVYCGMRGFRRDFYSSLDLRCTGMEFATEMLIKASLFQARIGELPITLHPDGRIAHAPHLRTFRDGWRTLRFFLLYSPRWLFFFPGIALMLMGAVVYGLVLTRTPIGRMNLDAHSLLFGSLFIIIGYQSVLFAVSAWTFATAEGLMPLTNRLSRWFKAVSLEKGLLAGVVSTLVGATLLARAILTWRAADFGNLDYSETMRTVIPGVMLVTIGFQTILSSFFLSVLGMQRPPKRSISPAGDTRTASEHRARVA
jgi:glycosyltransferase involved in cell wall biosynthesis